MCVKNESELVAKLPFYKMYMVREAISIPTVWFSLVLFYGVITLGTFATDFVSFTKSNCDCLQSHFISSHSLSCCNLV